MKNVFRDLTPPVLWRGAAKLQKTLVRKKQDYEFGVEQPPEFYDQTFKKSDHWKKHYTESHYYPVWTVIADRVRRLGCQRILDIGCGPGQVACLLRDTGVPEYHGLDFSQARVAMARIVCPEYSFSSADVFKDDSLEKDPYDCLITMEFLEHIEQDLDVLERVRRDVTVIATVPNFEAQGHVRHFQSVGEVEQRYAPFFNELEVTAILANQRGKTYFVLQGTR